MRTGPAGLGTDRISAICIRIPTPRVTCFIISPRETRRRRPSARPGNRATTSATAATATTSGPPAQTPQSTPNINAGHAAQPAAGAAGTTDEPKTAIQQVNRKTSRRQSDPTPVPDQPPPHPTASSSHVQRTKHERRSPPKGEAAGAGRLRQARPNDIGPRRRRVDRRRLRTEEHAPNHPDRHGNTRDQSGQYMKTNTPRNRSPLLPDTTMDTPQQPAITEHIPAHAGFHPSSLRERPRPIPAPARRANDATDSRGVSPQAGKPTTDWPRCRGRVRTLTEITLPCVKRPNR